jgi:hypothetical protein
MGLILSYFFLPFIPLLHFSSVFLSLFFLLSRMMPVIIQIDFWARKSKGEE